MKTLYVGNLPFSSTAEEIKELFGQYGEVANVEIIFDRMTGRPRGFCFVQMEDENAQKATEALNDQMFAGRKLQVNEARPKEERPPRDDRDGEFGNRPFHRRFDDRCDRGGFGGGERRPFRRRFDDRDDRGDRGDRGGFGGGERRPFRRRFDDRDDRGSFGGGEDRPFRRRFDDRDDRGGFGGERRPFRRRFDDRDDRGDRGGFGGGRRPFHRRFDDRPRRRDNENREKSSFGGGEENAE